MVLFRYGLGQMTDSTLTASKALLADKRLSNSRYGGSPPKEQHYAPGGSLLYINILPL